MFLQLIPDSLPNITTEFAHRTKKSIVIDDPSAAGIPTLGEEMDNDDFQWACSPPNVMQSTQAHRKQKLSIGGDSQWSGAIFPITVQALSVTSKADSDAFTFPSITRTEFRGINSPLASTSRSHKTILENPPNTPQNGAIPLSYQFEDQTLREKLRRIHRSPKDRQLQCLLELDKLNDKQQRHTPYTTPEHKPKPRVFEKLVRRLHADTFSEEEYEDEFLDGVYWQEDFKVTHESDDDLPSELSLEIRSASSDDREKQAERDIQIFKEWFLQHNLDPDQILSRQSSFVSAPLPIETPEISQCTSTGSPISEIEDTLLLQKQVERLALENKSKSIALEGAVEEMGRMELKIAKLEAKLQATEMAKQELETELKHVSKSRDRILVMANKQFNVCKKKMNPLCSEG